MAMSKLSSTRLDSGNSLRSNYFKLPGNVAWLTSCLPLPQPLPLPASRHMCAMWGCLSHCLYVCVCAATVIGAWQKHRPQCRGDFVDIVGRLEQTELPHCQAACLGCLRGTCHTPHATRRRRMPHTPHALRLVKLLILLPATLIFNK